MRVNDLHVLLRGRDDSGVALSSEGVVELFGLNGLLGLLGPGDPSRSRDGSGFPLDKVAVSSVILRSVSRVLIHVGCAKDGGCNEKPRPRISICNPSLGAYAIRRSEK